MYIYIFQKLKKIENLSLSLLDFDVLRLFVRLDLKLFTQMNLKFNSRVYCVNMNYLSIYISKIEKKIENLSLSSQQQQQIVSLGIIF